MKHVLLTGAARGIGLCATRLLASEGYKVYGIYNASGSEADRAKKENPDIEMIQCDLSQPDALKRVIADLKLVTFYAVINVAGIALGDSVPNFNMKDWTETFQVNLIAPLELVLGLQENIEQGGSIVNVGSTFGALWGMDMSLSYSASKAALANITKSLAVQLRDKKIRVNAVAPSIVDTDMTSQDTAEMLGEVSRRTAVGRIAKPQEVANVISFLISEKASYINGHTLIVDGGYSAWDGIY